MDQPHRGRELGVALPGQHGVGAGERLQGGSKPGQRGRSEVGQVGMQPQPVLRLLALFAVMTGCSVAYFGALIVMGFDFKAFKRAST